MWCLANCIINVESFADIFRNSTIPILFQMYKVLCWAHDEDRPSKFRLYRWVWCNTKFWTLACRGWGKTLSFCIQLYITCSDSLTLLSALLVTSSISYSFYQVADSEKQKRDAEEMGDAMKSLENRTLDSKREMDILAALDEMKSMKVLALLNVFYVIGYPFDSGKKWNL